jgi:bacterial/archaeal transporter family protein
LAATAAALTAILAKVGVEGVPSNLAAAFRTIVITGFARGIVAVTGEQRALPSVSRRSTPLPDLSRIARLRRMIVDRKVVCRTEEQ